MIYINPGKGVTEPYGNTGLVGKARKGEVTHVRRREYNLIHCDTVHRTETLTLVLSVSQYIKALGGTH